MIEVEIAMVRFDPEVKAPIVVLKEKQGNPRRLLPIWIGVFEAFAIVSEIEKQPVTRPMTHDLMKSIITNVGAEVISVLVSELDNSIFFAEITLKLGNNEIKKIDSRPSDAMALALRTGAKIYVAEKVMDDSGISPDIVQDDDKSQLKSILENMKPEDFGNNKL
ncbi:bifunctional nuclease family protein [Candidatus Poribacteria bacterium]|nr:bifunctional nuclease family protein [Candidatus Poribacteria bacterium]